MTELKPNELGQLVGKSGIFTITATYNNLGKYEITITAFHIFTISFTL